jgi:hypothetical protein
MNPDLFPIHDQAGMENFFNLGCTAAWSPTDRSGFSLSFLKSVEGRGGHKLDDQWTIAYTYGFGQH